MTQSSPGRPGILRGAAVFRAPDPGEVELAVPVPARNEQAEVQKDRNNEPSEADPEEAANPNNTAIRIDLSGIGAKRP
jgi:hypothetical protein